MFPGGGGGGGGVELGGGGGGWEDDWWPGGGGGISLTRSNLSAVHSPVPFRSLAVVALPTTAQIGYFASDQRLIMLVSLTNRTGWFPA